MAVSGALLSTLVVYHQVPWAPHSSTIIQRDACAQVHIPTARMTFLADLPLEILFRIIEELEDCWDVNSLVKTSHLFYNCLNQALYDHDARTRMYALEWASTNGVTELARKSLAASNRCKNENTISILHKAFLNSAANGHAEVTLLFLSQEEIDPSFQNEEGQTALGLSAANNHVNVVRLLLVVPGIAVNESDLKGRTPILNAVHSKSVENMTSLLRAKGLKIDVNREGRVDFQPKSPLSLASEYPEPDIAKLLLSSPAIHADQRGHNFQTALHWAANEGIEDTVKALLECGANPDPEDYEGNTPLFYATRRGNASIVRMLLEAGADPNHSGRYDDQPLNVARYFRCPEVERALLDCDRFDQALLRPPYRGKAWARRSFDPTADHP